MGIDYLTCKSCGEEFPDCGDFVWCECGATWCCEECAEKDGYIRQNCKKGLDEENCSRYYEQGCNGCEFYDEEASSCNYCRGEDYDDDKLLELALNLLGKDRNYLITEMNRIKGDMKNE